MTWEDIIKKKVTIKKPKTNRCHKCGEPLATFMGANTGLCENPSCSEYNPNKLMEYGFETYPRIKKRSDIAEELMSILYTDSKLLRAEYVKEILEKPNPVEFAIKDLEMRLKETELAKDTVVPYEMVMDDLNTRISRLKNAIAKLKKLGE